MCMTTRRAMMLVVVLALGVGANPPLAASVSISNPGFEKPVLAKKGDSISGSIPGWQLDTPGAGPIYYGVWWPSEFDYPGGVPDGQNIAFVDSQAPIGSGVVAIEQTLATALEPNTRYSLEVGLAISSSRPITTRCPLARASS
jgi:hypothetical protein